MICVDDTVQILFRLIYLFLALAMQEFMPNFYAHCAFHALILSV